MHELAKIEESGRDWINLLADDQEKTWIDNYCDREEEITRVVFDKPQNTDYLHKLEDEKKRYVRFYAGIAARDPLHERLACGFLGLKTEEQKRTEAAVRSAEAAERSAEAAVISAKNANSSKWISIVAVIVTAVGIALSKLL